MPWENLEQEIEGEFGYWAEVVEDEKETSDSFCHAASTERHRQAVARYYRANREKVKERARAWRKANYVPKPPRTSCRRGHEYTDENTRLYQGTRFCRACERERYRTERASPRGAAAKRTHCPKGHPYDDKNTYVNPASGARVCRACTRKNG